MPASQTASQMAERWWLLTWSIQEAVIHLWTLILPFDVHFVVTIISPSLLAKHTSFTSFLTY